MDLGGTLILGNLYLGTRRSALSVCCFEELGIYPHSAHRKQWPTPVQLRRPKLVLWYNVNDAQAIVYLIASFQSRAAAPKLSRGKRKNT
jgi:hypothetical protein